MNRIDERGFRAKRLVVRRAVPAFVFALSCLVASPALAKKKDKTEPDKPEVELPLEIHGGAWLWLYQPFDPIDVTNPMGANPKPNAQLYYAWITVDKQIGDFGLHAEPRFSDIRFRPYYDSSIWAQEAYVFWKNDLGTLKAGKEYTHLGYFWDGSFSNVLGYYDGYKLNPELGVSQEGTFTLGKQVSLDYDAQYFALDSTNGSLPGRDLVSISAISPGPPAVTVPAHRRDDFIGRVAPTIKVTKTLSITPGMSAEAFYADFPQVGATPTPANTVRRFNWELGVNFANLSAFGDFTHQAGTSTDAFPVAGGYSGAQTTWLGAAYALGLHGHLVKIRYGWSQEDFRDTPGAPGAVETIHNPGLIVGVGKNVSAQLEYVYWDIGNSGTRLISDRSLNFVLMGSF